MQSSKPEIRLAPVKSMQTRRRLGSALVVVTRVALRGHLAEWMHGIVESVDAMVVVQLCLQDLDQVVGDIVEMLSSFRVVSCRRSRYRRSRRRATRSLSRWSRWWSPPASVLEGHISIEVIFHSRLSLDSNPVPLLRNLFLFVGGEAFGLEDGI